MLVSLQNGGQKLSGRASKRFVPIAESCFRVGGRIRDKLLDW